MNVPSQSKQPRIWITPDREKSNPENPEVPKPRVVSDYDTLDFDWNLHKEQGCLLQPGLRSTDLCDVAPERRRAILNRRRILSERRRRAINRRRVTLDRRGIGVGRKGSSLDSERNRITSDSSGLGSEKSWYSPNRVGSETSDRVHIGSGSDRILFGSETFHGNRIGSQTSRIFPGSQTLDSHRLGSDTSVFYTNGNRIGSSLSSDREQLLSDGYRYRTGRQRTPYSSGFSESHSISSDKHLIPSDKLYGVEVQLTPDNTRRSSDRSYGGPVHHPDRQFLHDPRTPSDRFYPVGRITPENSRFTSDRLGYGSDRGHITPDNSQTSDKGSVKSDQGFYNLDKHSLRARKAPVAVIIPSDKNHDLDNWRSNNGSYKHYDIPTDREIFSPGSNFNFDTKRLSPDHPRLSVTPDRHLPPRWTPNIQDSDRITTTSDRLEFSNKHRTVTVFVVRKKNRIVSWCCCGRGFRQVMSACLPATSYKTHHENIDRYSLPRSRHYQPVGDRANMSYTDQTIRYSDDDTEGLSVTYITERIIAMLFPSGGLETTYQYHLEQVANMLQTKHANNCLVLNLSESKSEISKLNTQVVEFGWPENLAPPLERVCGLCKVLDNWLMSHPQHVVVIHCRGEQGRMGLIVASYMHYTNICASADQALDRFAMKRFYDDKLSVLTQPSQRRYVNYFAGLLSGSIKINSNPLYLHHILIHGVPNFDAKGGCRPYIKIYQSMQPLFNSGVYNVTDNMQKVCITIQPGIPLRGDILIKCYHKKFRSGGREIVWRCQLHTCAIAAYDVTLSKRELDDACFDPRFPESGRVELVFSSSEKATSNVAGFKSDITVPIDEVEDSLQRWDSYDKFDDVDAAINDIKQNGVSSHDQNHTPNHIQTTVDVNHAIGPINGNLYAIPTNLKTPPLQNGTTTRTEFHSSREMTLSSYENNPGDITPYQSIDTPGKTPNFPTSPFSTSSPYQHPSDIPVTSNQSSFTSPYEEIPGRRSSFDRQPLHVSSPYEEVTLTRKSSSGNKASQFTSPYEEITPVKKSPPMKMHSLYDEPIVVQTKKSYGLSPTVFDGLPNGNGNDSGVSINSGYIDNVSSSSGFHVNEISGNFKTMNYSPQQSPRQKAAMTSKEESQLDEILRELLGETSSTKTTTTTYKYSTSGKDGVNTADVYRTNYTSPTWNQQKVTTTRTLRGEEIRSPEVRSPSDVRSPTDRKPYIPRTAFTYTPGGADPIPTTPKYDDYQTRTDTQYTYTTNVDKSPKSPKSADLSWLEVQQQKLKAKQEGRTDKRVRQEKQLVEELKNAQNQFTLRRGVETERETDAYIPSQPGVVNGNAYTSYNYSTTSHDGTITPAYSTTSTLRQDTDMAYDFQDGYNWSTEFSTLTGKPKQKPPAVPPQKSPIAPIAPVTPMRSSSRDYMNQRSYTTSEWTSHHRPLGRQTSDTSYNRHNNTQQKTSTPPLSPRSYSPTRNYQTFSSSYKTEIPEPQTKSQSYKTEVFIHRNAPTAVKIPDDVDTTHTLDELEKLLKSTTTLEISPQPPPRPPQPITPYTNESSSQQQQQHMETRYETWKTVSNARNARPDLSPGWDNLASVPHGQLPHGQPHGSTHGSSHGYSDVTANRVYKVTPVSLAKPPLPFTNRLHANTNASNNNTYTPRNVTSYNSFGQPRLNSMTTTSKGYPTICKTNLLVKSLDDFNLLCDQSKNDDILCKPRTMSSSMSAYSIKSNNFTDSQVVSVTSSTSAYALSHQFPTSENAQNSMTSSKSAYTIPQPSPEVVTESTHTTTSPKSVCTMADLFTINERAQKHLPSSKSDYTLSDIFPKDESQHKTMTSSKSAYTISNKFPVDVEPAQKTMTSGPAPSSKNIDPVSPVQTFPNTNQNNDNLTNKSVCISQPSLNLTNQQHAHDSVSHQHETGFNQHHASPQNMENLFASTNRSHNIQVQKFETQQQQQQQQQQEAPIPVEPPSPVTKKSTVVEEENIMLRPIGVQTLEPSDGVSGGTLTVNRSPGYIVPETPPFPISPKTPYINQAPTPRFYTTRYLSTSTPAIYDTNTFTLRPDPRINYTSSSSLAYPGSASETTNFSYQRNIQNASDQQGHVTQQISPSIKTPLIVDQPYFNHVEPSTQQYQTTQTVTKTEIQQQQHQQPNIIIQQPQQIQQQNIIQQQTFAEQQQRQNTLLQQQKQQQEQQLVQQQLAQQQLAEQQKQERLAQQQLAQQQLAEQQKQERLAQQQLAQQQLAEQQKQERLAQQQLAQQQLADQHKQEQQNLLLQQQQLAEQQRQLQQAQQLQTQKLIQQQQQNQQILQQSSQNQQITTQQSQHSQTQHSPPQQNLLQQQQQSQHQQQQQQQQQSHQQFQTTEHQFYTTETTQNRQYGSEEQHSFGGQDLGGGQFGVQQQIGGTLPRALHVDTSRGYTSNTLNRSPLHSVSSPPSPGQVDRFRTHYNTAAGGHHPSGSMTLSPGAHSLTGQSSPSVYFGLSRRGSMTSLTDFDVVNTTPKFVKDTSKFWYKPHITREEAISLLKEKAPGTFVVRDSNSFPGAFGLAVKVAQVPANVHTKPSGDPLADLVRHFLIEPTPKGVRLKGCANEPVFGSLAALVYQHSMTPLALPCKLTLPEHDTDMVDGLLDSLASLTDAPASVSSHDTDMVDGLLDSPASPTDTPGSASSLLEQGAACNVLYLHTVDTESLTGPVAIAKALNVTLDIDPPVKTTVVHFKVSSQGITLTDNQRKLFFRRHYPVNAVTFCGLDKEDRRWKHTDDSHGTLINSKIFGFIARKQGGVSDNACHLFAELDRDQPASAIVNFVSKVMMGHGKK